MLHFSQSGKESMPVRLVFAPVGTGDAVFIDTGVQLYLVDCGAGIDYATVIRSLGHSSLSGLVLTHAHMDHWLALPEVLELLAPDAWVARSGTVLKPDAMRTQPIFEFYPRQIDFERVLNAWDSLTARPIPSGLPLSDANIRFSVPEVVLEEPDPIRMHQACIVPVLRWGARVAVFGADLDGAEWSRLAQELPPGVDVLQAPNHGGPPGRMARWVLDAHLRPDVVVVTDAQPFVDDHVEWYSGGGRRVYTLQERRAIHVELGVAGVSVALHGDVS